MFFFYTHWAGRLFFFLSMLHAYNARHLQSSPPAVKSTRAPRYPPFPPSRPPLPPLGGGVSPPQPCQSGCGGRDKRRRCGRGRHRRRAQAVRAPTIPLPFPSPQPRELLGSHLSTLRAPGGASHKLPRRPLASGPRRWRAAAERNCEVASWLRPGRASHPLPPPRLTGRRHKGRPPFPSPPTAREPPRPN